MKIVNTVRETRHIIQNARKEGKTVGFVPTMGYLHEGHLSLIRRAKAENGFVVVSIFVNPTQFGEGEDFETYPRNLKRDAALSESAGADLIFHPDAKEMYPAGYQTFVEVEKITAGLCGASRPGHFKGVATVVTKLFNIVKPDKAYFGQKDAQQVAVIEQMVRDLDMDLAIVPCPIVREPDGLAMSSRNTYLNSNERKAALILSQSLFKAKSLVDQGNRNAAEIRDFITAAIQSEPLAHIDYIEIVNAITLEKIDEIRGNVLIALAVEFGKIRLIDNIRMEA